MYLYFFISLSMFIYSYRRADVRRARGRRDGGGAVVGWTGLPRPPPWGYGGARVCLTAAGGARGGRSPTSGALGSSSSSMAGPGLHTPYRSLAIRAMRLFVRRDLQRCLHWRVVRTYPDKVEACPPPSRRLGFRPGS